MTLTSSWLPFWLFPLLLAAASVLSVWLYRTDRRSCGSLAGWAVTSLRVLLLALIIFLLLDPALVETSTDEKHGEVLVVIDTSPSMEIEDVEQGSGSISRIEAARKLLSSDWVENLRKQFRPSFHSLANKLTEVAGPPGQVETGTSPGTNLGAPILERALRSPREDLAGVFLLSDGNHNAPGDPRQAARSLGTLGIPIITLGIGRTDPPPDLALESIEAPRKVFKGDEISAEITLLSTGIETAEITVRVREDGRDLASFLIEEVPRAGISHWPLRFVIDEPGRHKLSIGFEAVRGEALEENNHGDVWIEVLDDKARVLYLEGAPRWEYRYLKNTWDRDEKISLDSYLVPAPPQRKLPDEFPRNPAELYSYDAIILGDIEPELLDAEIQETLLEYVKTRGGTLVLVSGPAAMPAAWQGTALEELLPVELLSPPPGRELGAQLARNGAALSLTAQGEKSEICRLVPGQQRNLELWEMLPPPRWYYPLRDTVEGSRTLASAGEEKAPVLVSREIGAGKVFYSGIDSTWKWRLRFGDLLYKRFWGQVIRWAVAEQLNAVDENVRLGTDKAVYRLPDDIEIAALIETGSGSGIDNGLVDAVIQSLPPEGEEPRRLRVRLEPIAGSGGRYRGRLGARQYAPLLAIMDTATGGGTREFELTLDIAALENYSTRADRARILFAIEPAAENESLGIFCNENNLRQLAELSGGAYLPLSAAANAAAHLPVKTRTVERTSTYAALDYPWFLALALVTLLAVEWITRKTLKLV